MAEKIGRIKRIRNTFARWFDWNSHAANWNYISDQSSRYLKVQPQDANVSFNEMVERYNLSEQDLVAKANNFWRLAVLDLFIFLLLLSYAIFMVVTMKFPGAFAALAITLVPLALAIRYHFWYFQIKERRLGCRLTEWFNKGILGRV